MAGPRAIESPYANDKLFYKNFRGGYFTSEYFWRDHQPWLQTQGYMLRPRYHPDWVPSGDRFDPMGEYEYLVRIKVGTFANFKLEDLTVTI